MARHKDPAYLLKFASKYGSEYVALSARMLRDDFKESFDKNTRDAFAREFKRLQKEEFASRRKLV